MAIKRHTIVVEGTLAFRMQRVAAARSGDHGRDVATLPLLAARLAGGNEAAAKAMAFSFYQQDVLNLVYV